MKFQQIWSKYGKSILFPCSVIGLAVIYFIFSQDDQTTSSPHLITPIEGSESTTVETTISQEEDIVTLPEQVIVDVKGAVKYPGIVELTTEHRIMDAIEAAGGYTDTANPVSINHAQKLLDEMVIYVPQHGENLEEVAIQTAGAATSTAGSTSTKDDGKVNLNTATEAELTTLPGIGPSKAASIITYREENGGFKTVDDLKNVSGIGDKTFDKLKDAIKVK